MFDHSKERWIEACGVSKERLRELLAIRTKVVGNSETWSEVVEKVVSVKELSRVELVLLGVLVGELMWR